ncbi:spidroin-2-like [Pteropus medius]|uniref:spidroin-2-like n=1 Tax=Pteropus vampyrus TaxID=132908 RepID=UPI00196A36F9|nr:spidroin-2-like [Pteropus giganteus]
MHQKEPKEALKSQLSSGALSGKQGERVRFDAWGRADRIPAPRPDRRLQAQLLPQQPGQKHPEYQDARLPPPPPRPKAKDGKGEEGEEGGEGKKATPPPHAQAHTQEPLCKGEEAATSAVRAARGKAPGRHQPGAAAAVATAGCGASQTALPGALRSSRSGQRRCGGEGATESDGLRREGEGAAEDPLWRRLAVGAVSRNRAGQGGSRWRRGTRRRLPGTAGPANVTVSPAERSHPLTLMLTRTLAPTLATARSRGPQHPSPHPPGGYLQLPSAEVATFSKPAAAAAPSSRLGFLAPFGLGSRRPALPSPLGSTRGLHHISPWSAAHARRRARGSGARGCACIARLLLAAHTVHGSEGAGEGGTGPLAAPAAAAAPVQSSAPAQRRPPRWDPAAAVPAPSPLLPPPQPLINICTAHASSWLFHRSRCLQIFFFFYISLP